MLDFLARLFLGISLVVISVIVLSTPIMLMILVWMAVDH